MNDMDEENIKAEINRIDKEIKMMEDAKEEESLIEPFRKKKQE